MNWINFSSALGIGFSFIVFLQGLSILMAAERKMAWRIVGSLTIALAVLGMTIIALFLSTEVVFSPEFGVIIIQGWSSPSSSPSFCWVCCCVSRGAGTLPGCKRAGGNEEIGLHLLSIAVWLLSISILAIRAKADSFDATPIFLYDVWWPVLPLWFTVGFTDIAQTIRRVDNAEVPSAAAISMAFLTTVVATLFLFVYSPDWYWQYFDAIRLGGSIVYYARSDSGPGAP